MEMLKEILESSVIIKVLVLNIGKYCYGIFE
jgi:hypothetical protein